MNNLVLSTRITPTTYEQAVIQIAKWAKTRKSHSIFAANVHMVMLAHDSPQFLHVINSADMVTPDGMPLVWVMRLKGNKSQQRVYGPTLMLKVCETAEREGLSVGFMGGTTDLLSELEYNLNRKFPALNIDLLLSPPFHELSSAEDEHMVQIIRDSGVQILFVGLGCPKQENWIYNHREVVQVVMIGVGAGFAFHSGKVKQAPAWIQRAGLEWLFRLVQEPGRLWKRYLFTNPRFIVLESLELCRERFLNGANKKC